MFNFLFQGKVGNIIAPVESPEAQLLISIQNRQPDKIHELLEVQGVSANSANDRGIRPMHIACQCGNMPLVHRLLELGADIISADKAGNTPLHYASKGGHTEMVKVLVGQGAGVEKRNGSGLSAYDVATDHVIRQFLLPLQLKAEAGNPEYAVQTMGITSDTPRNYEAFGAPSIGHSHTPQGQPYGHLNASSAGPDPMSTALGALMQAPGVPPPRPGGNVYSGGPDSTPSQQPGFISPPESGGAGYGVPPSSFTPPPHAMGPPHVSAVPAMPVLTSGSHAPPPTIFAPFPGATSAVTTSVAAEASKFNPAMTQKEDVVTPTTPKGAIHRSTGSFSPPVSAPMGGFPPEVSIQSFPGVAVQARPAAATTDSGRLPSTTSPQGTGADDGITISSATSTGPAAVELFTVESETPATPDVVACANLNRQPFSGVPIHVQQGRGAQNVVGEQPPQPSAEAVGVGAQSSAMMSTVDFSMAFQAQAAIFGAESSTSPKKAGFHLPPATHPSSAPLSGGGGVVAPPSRPPGAYTPSPGPHQPAGEKPGKFKAIKPDGFHSSASDKTLQARYGHTKIVRDMGAPPTAAQLGGPQRGPGVGSAPYGVGAPPMGSRMAGQPPAGPPNNGGYPPAQAPPLQYAYSPAGHYGQLFGGGGGVGVQQGFGQQPFGQPPPGTHQQIPMQAHPSPPSILNSSAPGEGSYTHPHAAGGSAPPPPAFPPAGHGTGSGGGGFSIFNPTTDKVVAADSNSNAVL